MTRPSTTGTEDSLAQGAQKGKKMGSLAPPAAHVKVKDMHSEKVIPRGPAERASAGAVVVEFFVTKQFRGATEARSGSGAPR